MLEQNTLLDFFLQPESYPHNPQQVELIQTHASWVFLAGEYVFKVKKPVNFGFLDFSSLKKRRFYCAEEIRLNRRLAPDVYLGLWAVLRDSHGGLRLGGLEHAEAVEYTVQMRRLDQEHMLDNLLQQGQVKAEKLHQVAQKLVDFHQGAATGGEIDQLGSPGVIRSNHTENFEQTKPFLDWSIPASRYRFIKCYSYGFIKENRELLLRRKAQGRIREGHGDLRCEHVCLESGDRIQIFDCIEFNARFRYIDVAAEVAFLAMDMELDGHSRLSRSFVLSYAEQSLDPELQQLCNFYKCYYAFTRGKVHSFRLQETSPSQNEQQNLLQHARLCFEQSFRYACRLESKALLLLCGLSGSGKSYLADQIAPLLGVQVLRSDVLRKQLQGLPAQAQKSESYAQGLYSSQVTEEVYSSMLQQAEGLLNQDQAVLLDATFLQRKHRLQALELAREQNCKFFVLHCSCPEGEVQRRMLLR
ncbi:MAG: AAA family ATPase, partial [Thermodesulfobacteriota bacterium]